MNNITFDPVKRAVWKEVAKTFAEDRNVERCLCFGREFYNYLRREASLPFPLAYVRKSGPPMQEHDLCDLIVGWEVLKKKAGIPMLEWMYRTVKKGGEVRLFGYYLHPSPDDIFSWERECGVSHHLPAPGAISFGQITAWLKSAPFDRYTVRKRGIYYQVILRKE
ncbi:MAG: hypothetical protein RAO92_02555 [Candidatus Euphemobacter frigidus]|nr:hypothetical protein [Candidatus Euphemobacter frigidus]MDP8275261.1 hypothetical protein [Candidatus Euphemobacter frigidus]